MPLKVSAPTDSDAPPRRCGSRFHVFALYDEGHAPYARHRGPWFVTALSRHGEIQAQLPTEAFDLRTRGVALARCDDQHLLRFRQLTAHPVEVHDALRWVVVSQDFGVELADPGGFALCELVPCRQNSDFVKEIMIRFSMALCVCQVSRQPGSVHISTSRQAEQHVK